MSLRSSFACLVAVAGAAFASPLAAQSRKVVVAPPGATPSPVLSPAVRVGDVLFVSGQLAARGESTIQGQTRSVLESIKTIVEAAGSSMADVAKCTVFLKNLEDFAGMNEVYTTFFPKEPPARSTIVVAALVRPDAKLEIECIAAAAR